MYCDRIVARHRGASFALLGIWPTPGPDFWLCDDIHRVIVFLMLFHFLFLLASQPFPS